MSEEIQLPPLPQGFRWKHHSVHPMSFCLQKHYGKRRDGEDKWENIGFVGSNFSVAVWKRPAPGAGRWEPRGECETLQQALNMAAALVALGEADE